MKKFNKNTVIIANYIYVGCLNDNDTFEYLDDISKVLDLDGNIIQRFIPIKEGNSYIECVYPKFIVSDEEFDRINDELKTIEENFLNIIKNSSEKINN